MLMRADPEVLRWLLDEVAEKVREHDSSPAHLVGRPCKTCDDSGLVEDHHEGHGGTVFVSCPDCSGEPFPLP